LPSEAAFDSRAYNLSASNVEGSGSTGKEPCFDATAEAEYGRFRDENRGEEKNEDISEVRASNSAVSASRDGGCKGNLGTEDIARPARYSAGNLRVDRADRRAVDIVYKREGPRSRDTQRLESERLN